MRASFLRCTTLHRHPRTPTNRKLCRPRLFQELLYSGYYKGHGLKFQSIVSPCGLVLDLYGPEMGRRNDIWLWYRSRVGEAMDALPLHPNGGRYVLYGDSAYRKAGAADHIACAFPRTRPLSVMERAFNKSYNKCRVVVEWAFGHVYSLWASFRYLPSLKTGQSNIGRRFLAAVLLYNFRTCLNKGNQISLYYNIAPPTLAAYIAGPRPPRARWADEEDMYVHVLAHAYGGNDSD